MKVYYECKYDGKKCYVVPQVNKFGEIIPESNTEIKKKYQNCVSPSVLNECWDICDTCPRNYSLSAGCHGILKIGD